VHHLGANATPANQQTFVNEVLNGASHGGARKTKAIG
jgi:hypothetical protein